MNILPSELKSILRKRESKKLDKTFNRVCLIVLPFLIVSCVFVLIGSRGIEDSSTYLYSGSVISADVDGVLTVDNVVVKPEPTGDADSRRWYAYGVAMVSVIAVVYCGVTLALFSKLHRRVEERFDLFVISGVTQLTIGENLEDSSL